MAVGNTKQLPNRSYKAVDTKLSGMNQTSAKGGDIDNSRHPINIGILDEMCSMCKTGVGR